MKRLWLYVLLILAGVTARAQTGVSYSDGKDPKNIKSSANSHILEIRERVLNFDDGLIIGNGDLSVSVYESSDRIIWRFGKNDVWDRRLDRSDSYKPVHIKELINGIKNEGWKSDGFGLESHPVALHGTKDPQRMREVVGGSPPEYSTRPYPCPKPVGELVMQLPPDLANLKIVQRLVIEEGRIEILCSYPSGVEIMVECFIPSSPNVLVVNWKVKNWSDDTKTGRDRQPVWFWLKRWADPDYNVYNLNYKGDFLSSIQQPVSSRVTPLPPPGVKEFNGATLIEQTFGKDSLFREGFRYWAVPYAPGMKIVPVDMSPSREARIRIMPDDKMDEGWLAVQIATSSDPGGVEQGVSNIRKFFDQDTVLVMKKLKEQNVNDSKKFWSKSGLSIDDPLLENLWYETLHIRRSTTRAGIDPPGLFLPSTVHDYSRWHGDYHTNYNLQSPFFGDYTANHVEIGDAYFKAIDYFLYVGRKIARDYFDSRGAFIQLLGYPMYAEDDPYGTGFCSRMVYMTGWTFNQYWWRYLYTQDKNWLREVGYPAIREGALFFTDFLSKGKDGLYHAFPSQTGENELTGNPEDLTDQWQAMRHMRYLLRVAIKASEVLMVDKDLRAQWKDRVENSAPDRYADKEPGALYGYPGPPENDLERLIDASNPPEFGYGKLYTAKLPDANSPSLLKRVDEMYSWYFGQFPLALMKFLREGSYDADRDFDDFRKMLIRWRRPNGIMQGMAIANYGYAGAWTESLGIIAPLQEMMLQSWDGAIRIFPAFPSSISASFRDFRAEGAFLVSAEKKGDTLNYVRIESLSGLPLRIYNPYSIEERVRIIDISTGKILLEGSYERLKILEIKTEKDHKYLFERAKKS